MSTILLKVKIQSIYFQTPEDKLGIKHATSHKKITLAEAGEILEKQEIPYDEILRVKYENVKLEIPMNEYENYLQ